jgi:protein SCO1/2
MRIGRYAYRLIAAALALATCGIPIKSCADDPASRPSQLRAVGFDQHLGEQVPLDAEFVDESGKTVRLGDYFRGKPVILVMAYYRCPMLCTLVLNGLVQGMIDMSFDVGKDFEVITVSFDPRETPGLAAAKKQTYLSRYRRPGAAVGWHFLTGKEASIRRLAQSIGFRYVYDSATDQFAHAAGLVILTPEGKLARYFYDISFPGRDLRLGLVEASAHKIGSRVDEVMLLCFHYDPTTGKYGLAVMNFIRLGGLLTLVALTAFIGLQVRRERKRAVNPIASTEANHGIHGCH